MLRRSRHAVSGQIEGLTSSKPARHSTPIARANVEARLAARLKILDLKPRHDGTRRAVSHGFEQLGHSGRFTLDLGLDGSV